MQSTNFEFLRPTPDFAALADLAGFAEAYAHPDPVSALVKLRTFGEALTLALYYRFRLVRPVQANFNDLLAESSFKAVVPAFVVNVLHGLRKEGNAAAHGQKLDTPVALWGLRQAFTLASWVHVAHGGGRAGDLPKYTEPGPEDQPAQKRAVLLKLAEQERQLEQVLAELEAARAQAKAAETTAAELKALHENALAAGVAAADALHFDEETTRRRLIDRYLAEAGWNVGADGADTEQVKQDHELTDASTPSGKGRADYVLFGTDGRPLAVVEAKKAVAGAEIGWAQARIYADGLEQEYGVRPFIFTTNGYDVWFWNDAAGEPQRKVYGFHAPDSLAYKRFQLTERKPLAAVAPASGIIDARLYQQEAVKRVVERFAQNKRRALIVQATGTGKTRVAVALCSALSRARWAKRVLFLCDRRELLNQADQAFKEFLDDLPRTTVSAGSAHDKDKRVYLATYPAMMKCFTTFDVGFFDLVIADETHRSIFNRYRAIFDYFDARQVGLTATPVGFVNRNTFRLFGCEVDDPTFNYTYEEAVANDPPYLVPYEVESYTTEFLRTGIKYSQMSREQREQLEDAEDDPTRVEHDAGEVDRLAYNRPTNLLILRNLMERGIRDATGSRVGKTIVFARNYEHAKLLKAVFDEEWPQYGGTFCQLITSHDPRASALTGNFKVKAGDPVIAISVDMLDTGVDVPEVVNLVFAKPVYSFAKFWQMIGRGSRPCADLFGPGRDKEKFLIFDHWNNFEWFEQHAPKADPKPPKSLMQRVFEAHVRLADDALAAQDADAFKYAVGLIREDIKSLPERSLAVRDKIKSVQAVLKPGVLDAFEAATRDLLLREIGPLMQWVDIGRHADAYEFDRLVAETQAEVLKGSGKVADYRAEVTGAVGALRVNLSQVAEKLELVARAKAADFWAAPTVPELEVIRCGLREVMHLKLPPTKPTAPAKVYDIQEDETKVERRAVAPGLQGFEFVAYKNRVKSVLTDLFDTNPTLKKIRAGEPVAEPDLQALVSLVLVQDPTLNLADLAEYYPATAGHLDRAIRAVIGLDAAAVRARFNAFAAQHPGLNSLQVKFLDLLANQIGRAGAVTLEDLYKAPFTLLNAAGLDGVFPDPLDKELLDAIAPYTPADGPNAEPG
ncbi:DEAD/DEAH box helicase family protein [Gemmata sp. JC673]|uniref:DEAD/DEAH box helicase family protein n=1 Tax=Gemmata algarum TaxID=2975278 RepID=A0ABU5F5R7_9BACT|nr:DEAD/DEAH box helicase family protein [Gemmata algarum]MDY3562696.1 DEAD/DEAH box helicase family protein [Gemmata algarum]